MQADGAVVSNIDVLARMDSALLVERQQQAQHHCISILTESIDRSLCERGRRDARDFEFGVEQAAAGCVFVFEVECQLAARWS